MTSGPDEPGPAERLHRVVIVGCGFGGLFAAKALKGAKAQVTLIERTNHHLFAPLLYQVATGILSAGEIAPAARDVLRKQRNLTVEMGEVTAIDATARRLDVRCPDGSARSVGYDSLILAGGMKTSYFGNDGFERWAPGMKMIEEARQELAEELLKVKDTVKAEADRALEALKADSDRLASEVVEKIMKRGR